MFSFTPTQSSQRGTPQHVLSSLTLGVLHRTTTPCNSLQVRKHLNIS